MLKIRVKTAIKWGFVFNKAERSASAFDVFDKFDSQVPECS